MVGVVVRVILWLLHANQYAPLNQALLIEQLHNHLIPGSSLIILIQIQCLVYVCVYYAYYLVSVFNKYFCLCN